MGKYFRQEVRVHVEVGEAQAHCVRTIIMSGRSVRDLRGDLTIMRLQGMHVDVDHKTAQIVTCGNTTLEEARTRWELGMCLPWRARPAKHAHPRVRQQIGELP